jgi:alpha-galactosidase
MAMDLLVDASGPLEVAAAVTGDPDGDGARVDWSVRNAGRRRERVRGVRLGWTLDGPVGQVVEQGWQSWSPVRVCSPDDVLADRARASRWRRAMYCATGDAAGRIVLGDHVLAHDRGVVGFLGAQHNLGTVAMDPSGALVIRALLDGITIGPGEERRLDPVWIATGDPGQRVVEHAERWAAQASARARTPAFRGWCSWYRFGAGVTPADVRAQLAPAADHGVDVIQIDDGWQAAVGDWTSCSPPWRDELGAVAADIRQTGLRAGIWTAPFVATARSSLVRAHPDWLLRDHRGAVGAMHHPALWGGWAYALDLTHPAVLDHLQATFTELVAAGFTVHKLDFLYAGALPGRRHDRHATRAEALRRGLAAIRAAVGDAFVLACGCPLGPAAGLVDAMRVSPDTTIAWEPRRHDPGFRDAAPAAGNAARAAALRAAWHRRLWINDADCLMLRHPLDERTPAQRAALVDTVTTTAPFAMVSDDLRDYRAEDWAVLDAMAAHPDAAPEPADPFGRVAHR